MKKLLGRFSESSSWAGIGVLLGLVGVQLPNETLQLIAKTGSALCGVAAFFIPESKKN